MTSLDELAACEVDLYASVTRAVGSMDQKHAALEAAGVFTAYADVLAGYLRLLDDPAAAHEALKRATFLVWYSVAEPGCFTGVGPIPAPLVQATLAALEAAIARGALDGEFAAMLGYYEAVADFAFTRGGPWPGLARARAVSDPDAWRTEVPPPERPWLRGQMGEYWASISRVT